MPLDLSKLTRKARWRRPILSPTVAHHSTLIGSSLSLSLSRTINSRTTHTVLLSLFLLAVSPRFSFSLSQSLHNCFLPFFLKSSKSRSQMSENARIRLPLLSLSDVTSNYGWAHTGTHFDNSVPLFVPSVFSTTEGLVDEVKVCVE